jgi:hypothetical protein
MAASAPNRTMATLDPGIILPPRETVDNSCGKRRSPDLPPCCMAHPSVGWLRGLDSPGAILFRSRHVSRSPWGLSPSRGLA